MGTNGDGEGQKIYLTHKGGGVVTKIIWRTRGRGSELSQEAVHNEKNEIYY